jgi:hypothetical protein
MAAAEFLYGRITVPRSLALVTSVAGQLVEATASTAGEVTEQVLARLVAQFDLDYSFLRRNWWPRASKRIMPHSP